MFQKDKKKSALKKIKLPVMLHTHYKYPNSSFQMSVGPTGRKLITRTIQTLHNKIDTIICNNDIQKFSIPKCGYLQCVTPLAQ